MEHRVAVVEDRSVAFRGVVQVLRESAGVRFAGVFASLAECERGIPGPERTVVVTDPFPGPPPAMPRSRCLRLLVMSASCHPDDVRAALGNGAGGYISKESDIGTLVRAIAAVAAGDLYLDGRLQAVLAEGAPRMPVGEDVVLGGVAGPGGHLTRREREVLQFVAEGLTHRQIGSQLGLSKATVDTYVHRIRQKTGTPNKAGLTRIAMALELDR